MGVIVKYEFRFSLLFMWLVWRIAHDVGRKDKLQHMDNTPYVSIEILKTMFMTIHEAH